MPALASKRTIVTAGAKGIGRAIVERFVAEGARVAFCDIDAEAGAALAKELGERAKFFSADCAEMAAVRGFVDAAMEWLGGVDVLVNNAGVAIPGGILDLTEEAFDRTMVINLKSGFVASQMVAKRMIADGVRGAIVNMSSVNAVMAIPHILAYNMSKGALNQLTRNSAISLAEHGSGLTPSAREQSSPISYASRSSPPTRRAAPPCRARRCAARESPRRSPRSRCSWRRRSHRTSPGR